MSDAKDHNRNIPNFYMELPPEHFVARFAGKNARLNQAEFERVQWFWERRPNLDFSTLHATLNMLAVYIVLFTPLIHATQPNLIWIVHLIVSGAILILLLARGFLRVARHNKWKSNYDSAVIRLLRRQGSRP